MWFNGHLVVYRQVALRTANIKFLHKPKQETLRKTCEAMFLLETRAKCHEKIQKVEGQES